MAEVALFIGSLRSRALAGTTPRKIERCADEDYDFFSPAKIFRGAIFSRRRFPKREFHLIRRRPSVVHLRADIPEDPRGRGTFFAVEDCATR